MVQLKYFGDDRDFFKYDLITHIFSETSCLDNYVFIPMLTEHRIDNEGNVAPKHNGDRSDDLFQFISHCPNKSLNHWESWLETSVQSYKTVEPVDRTFFSDVNRLSYWKKFEGIINTENSLIFVDPDTGLETGSPSYLQKAGREKYLLNTELQHLIENLSESSVLMIYQHLQRNKKRHDMDVEKKIDQVESIDDSILVSAYREDDLAFLFIAKKTELHNDVFNVLTEYHAKSTHQYREVYGCFASGNESKPVPSEITLNSSVDEVISCNDVIAKKQLGKISTEAERLILDKPCAWEFLLFSQVLFDLVSTVKVNLSTQKDVTGSSLKEYSEASLVPWLLEKISIYIESLKQMKALLGDDFTSAVGDKGVTGNSKNIISVVSQIVEQYRKLANIVNECNLVIEPNSLNKYKSFLIGICSDFINEIDAWVQDMHSNLPVAIERGEKNVNFTLNLLYPQNLDEHIDELGSMELTPLITKRIDVDAYINEPQYLAYKKEFEADTLSRRNTEIAPIVILGIILLACLVSLELSPLVWSICVSLFIFFAAIVWGGIDDKKYAGYYEHLGLTKYEKSKNLITQAAPVIYSAISKKELSQQDKEFLIEIAADQEVQIILSDELKSYHELWELEFGTIPETRPISSDINLSKEEQCYFQCNSKWRQSKITKETFGFVGGSISGFFGGIPLTYDRDEIVEMSDGSLYVTNKKILFIGGMKSTNITIGRIAKIEMFSDALKVNKTSGKPDIFMLPSKNEAIKICSILMDLGYLSAI
jgi:hypothetical protein